MYVCTRVKPAISSAVDLMEQISTGEFKCNTNANAGPSLSYVYKTNNGTDQVVDKSNDDIRHSLSGKWIFFYGDSTLRMLHDILAMRLSDGTERYWPNGVDNHGPLRLHLSQAGHSNITYETYIGTTRLTFMWHHLAVNKPTDLHNYFVNYLGYPDVFIPTNGVWEGLEWKKEEQESFMSGIFSAFKPPVEKTAVVYHKVWKNKRPIKIFASVNYCTNFRNNNYENYKANIKVQQSKAFLDTLGDVLFWNRMYPRPVDFSADCQRLFVSVCNAEYHYFGELLSVQADILAMIVDELFQ
jgi:hypothetical protein